MPRKIDIEKKINDIDKKINQLKNQKNQAKKRLSVEARKKRTRELIQIGSEFKSIGIDNIEIAKKFREYYLNNDNFKNEFDTLIKNITK